MPFPALPAEPLPVFFPKAKSCKALPSTRTKLDMFSRNFPQNRTCAGKWRVTSRSGASQNVVFLCLKRIDSMIMRWYNSLVDCRALQSKIILYTACFECFPQFEINMWILQQIYLTIPGFFCCKFDWLPEKY